MSGWVLTADRKPTVDDADENGVVYVMCSGTVAQCPQENVHLHKVWHPKPKAEKPEPYKPPVPERLELWAIVFPNGMWACYSAREYAEQDVKEGQRIAHLREVRDGDPSPEDVAAVREYIANVIELAGVNAYCDVSIVTLRNWLELLGGKP